MPTIAARRIVYILRGLPGSGKSTVARRIGAGGVVLSTDEYFVHDRRYEFSAELLSDAHEWNQRRALTAIVAGVSPIVIDNTHVRCWEARPYVEAAVAHGYAVEVVEPDTSWKRDPDELARRTMHGVASDVIARMLAEWEEPFTLQMILSADRPTQHSQ